MFEWVIHHTQGELRILAQNCTTHRNMLERFGKKYTYQIQNVHLVGVLKK